MDEGLKWVAQFSGTGGEVRYNTTIGRLYIDLDGDAAADFSVDLDSAPDLSAGNLIF